MRDVKAKVTVRFAFIAILLMASTFSTTAQSFSWGFPFHMDDEIDYSVQHFEDGDIFRIKSKYRLADFDYVIQSDRLSKAELERIETTDLSAINENPIDALKTHLNMHQIDGKEFLFFSSEYIGDTKATKLYRQNVNAETGVRSAYVEVTSVEGKGTLNTGRFETAMSPDGAYFAVVKVPAFYKKEQETIAVEVYDAEFNKVHEINHLFDRQAKRGPLYSVYIANDGEVYLVSRLDLKKQLPHLEVYTAGLTDKAFETTTLRQEDDFQLVQSYPYFIENDLCLVSVVSITGASGVQIRPDYDGRSLGARGSGLLLTRFSGGQLLYNERTDFENSVPNLMIKDVLAADGGHYIVMEQLFESAKSTATNLTDANAKMDYSYLNDGFMVAHCDISSGAVNWFYQIQIDEPDTKNDNGAYLSVLPLVKGSMLVLLYNETRVLNGKDGNRRRRFPIIEVISATGETVRKEPLMAAGVGAEYFQNIELDTSVIHQLDENKYLVRGRSRAEYKYGYLTF